MKSIILLCLSLFVFVSTDPPATITIDLVASQTITAGTGVEVKLSVTAGTNGMVLKTLSGLKLKKDASTSADLTCTIAAAGITCEAGKAATVPCTATLSAAGTYSLDDSVTVTLTAKESDDSTDISSPVKPTIGSTSATVNAAGTGGSGTGGSGTGGSSSGGSSSSGTGTGDSSTGGSSSGGSSSGGSDANYGSKFMEISFLLLLFCFLF